MERHKIDRISRQSRKDNDGSRRSITAAIGEDDQQQTQQHSSQ